MPTMAWVRAVVKVEASQTFAKRQMSGLAAGPTSVAVLVVREAATVQPAAIHNLPKGPGLATNAMIVFCFRDAT